MNNAELTSRMQQTWATGDFNRVAMGILDVSDALVRAVDVRPGEQVLDVACGSGNAALAAARRYADVVGLDYVPSLIARARLRCRGRRQPRSNSRSAMSQALPVRSSGAARESSRRPAAYLRWPAPGRGAARALVRVHLDGHTRSHSGVARDRHGRQRLAHEEHGTAASGANGDGAPPEHGRRRDSLYSAATVSRTRRTFFRT